MTQGRFAALIGASLDAVKSWERRRKPNRISPSFQTSILWETGAEFYGGSITGSWRFLNELANQPYTKAHFVYWRECLARSDVARAEELIAQGQAAIKAILNAAVNRRGKPLRAVWQSFEDWFAQTTNNFKLGDDIRRLAPKGAEKPFLGARGPCIWLLPAEKRTPKA
jgi:hypothetical protein